MLEEKYVKSFDKNGLIKCVTYKPSFDSKPGHHDVVEY